MGSTQSCFKQQNLNQDEFSIPHIVKQKLIQQHPTKQNYLIQPLYHLGEKSESLEELELILQLSNANISLNQTATFPNNSNQGYSQQDKQSISLSLLSSQQECQQKINKDNQIQTRQQTKYQTRYQTRNQHRYQPRYQKLKTQQLKQEGQKEEKITSQLYQRKKISRSLSNFQLQKYEQQNQVNKQIDSDCNPIKSILKNKSLIENQKYILYKRRQSLKQKSNLIQINDQESQKTSQKQMKKVQFDPIVFRQKSFQ